ncbi:hypothetical protein KUTeg_014774 [Tegillarca granosa]|uniref:GPI ethanolamine phosphate transferase 2 C-terminal domain-containing protein n=1 Tax=Tegillarca granosa TaxID=220873 RepID=A0ABQ9ER77_TEGGR|nr:hypothetical protein KUTeg_014774 [Tegillarca granosa]
MVQVVKAFIVDCSTSMGVNEARLGFIMIAIFMLLSFLTLLKQKREKKQKNISLEFIVTLHKSWILLMTLLVRPHSIPMVAIITIQEYIISRYISRNMQLPITFLTLYYLWMGKASYFYQGNSNSISTVDVSAGYIGLDDYQPVIVAVLLCLSTYAGIVFWLLSNNNHNTRFPGLWRYDIKIRNMTSLNNRFVCSHVISYSPTVENIFENKNGEAEFQFRSDFDKVESLTSKTNVNSFTNDRLLNQKNDLGNDIRMQEHCRFYKSIIIGCVAVLVLCRILRTWNQTGDKWLNIPDIGDWLVRPENKLVLSLSGGNWSKM